MPAVTDSTLASGRTIRLLALDQSVAALYWITSNRQEASHLMKPSSPGGLNM